MKNGPVYGRGLPKLQSAPKQQWMNWCAQAILDHLALEHAAPRVELDHRLYEKGCLVGDKVLHFDPHIITPTINDLLASGVIQTVTQSTSGGGSVEVIIRTDLPRTKTAIDRAIRRKSLLYRRLTVITATAGAAGEQVLRHSLSVAGDHLAPVLKGYAEVPELLGVPLRGPLDSAAYLITKGGDDMPYLIVAPIEMKNRRLVLYPTHDEVHQLLHKTATVQNRKPEASILPILICRRAHRYLAVRQHSEVARPPKLSQSGQGCDGRDLAGA